MKRSIAFMAMLFMIKASMAQGPFTDTARILQEVKVTGRKPLIRMSQGKIVIQPDAMVTNAGTTVLEMLEKLPGVTIDKDNKISLKGKSSVLILIDDKQTYLDASELASLLASMNAQQLERIELINNPTARYDAAGNAGIINIKTKRNRENGFNGTLTVSAGAGRYYKNNNSLSVNYRKGKISSYLTYSMNHNKGYTDIYALRKYYDDNASLISVLDQPTYLTATSFNNTLRAGMDYYISGRTTAGITVTSMSVSKKGNGEATATWQNAGGLVDSAIATYNNSSNRFKNGGLNFNLKHVINKTQDVSIDLDGLAYDIHNRQFFNNRLLAPAGYTDSSRGNVPARINILSAKADHTLRFGEGRKLESGFKTSHISTDNTAAYEIHDGMEWKEDVDKSNRFIYNEHIYALYSSLDYKLEQFNFATGFRFEQTQYNARQTDSRQTKDSSFSRNYSSLFPSASVTWEADSSNSFTLTTGRRIDRPAFQALNPFVFIINKYTQQKGNPFFRPQYAWNIDLGHQYKQVLTTGVSYSIIRDYFSQLFLTGDNGILIYAEGNVGQMHNFGLSATVQLSPIKWWSFTASAIANYKKLKGFVGNTIRSSVTQLTTNMSNHFRIHNNITAELSGFYTTRSRNDLQELLSPTGQVSVGFSVPVLHKKGTLKASMRDIFYTQAMEGVTDFRQASEYFILRRDTRVVNISFVYNFGKLFKNSRRSDGGASDEKQRAAAES